MAWYKVEGEKLSAIADGIRRKTGDTAKLGLDAMVSGVGQVYDKGYEGGYDEGYGNGFNNGYVRGEEIGYHEGKYAGIAEGITQGRQAEYDRLWDSYQENGNRTDYTNAFCGGWTDEIFAPKYDIIADTCTQMFSKNKITNLAQCIRDAGVRFDTSNAKNFSYMFNYATAMVEIPHLDLRNATNISYLFNGCSALRKVLLTFAENTTTSYNNLFSGCRVLDELMVAGVIDIPLSLSSSPNLMEDSVQSIITALKDLTGQTAKTLTLHATVGGKLTDGQKATITAKNWTLVY